MTAYAPKRIGYKHDGYVARMEAAYIDHNSHIGREQMITKDGKKVYTRKWSKRSKRWLDVPIPSPKSYPYSAGMFMYAYIMNLCYSTYNTSADTSDYRILAQ